MTSSPSPSTAEAAVAARLRRIVLFLRRKWWIPALVMLLSVAGQAAWVLTQPESNTAVSRMWVGGKVRLQESSLFSEEWQNFFGTQTELMQSEKIRRRVLQQMKGRAAEGGMAPIRIEVSQPRKTTIFNLTAVGPDPAYLETYLNTAMDEYLKYRREVRASSSDDTVASLAEQLEKVEREIKTENDQLTDIQRTNNITVLQEMSVSAGNQLIKLNLQLADLKLESELMALVSPEENLEKQAEAISLSTRRSLGDAVLSSGSAQKDYFTARQQRDLKKLEEKELSETLRAEHPTMIRLKEEITRLDALLDIYREQSREQLDATRDTVRLKIRAVDDAIRTWEPRVVDANERLAQYKRSRMNLERVEGMQSRLLQAMHSVDVNKSVDQESVSIMDKAVVFPTPRRLPFKLALAAVVGLTLGIGMVLFLEQRDQRLLSLTEARLNVPARLIGYLPEMVSRKARSPLKLLTPDDDRHIFVESFRNLRTSLRSLWPARSGPRTVLITSALPDEGKSTVSANLALALAFSGARVLLIDGDLRRGRLHEVFDLKAEPGLNELLGSSRVPEEFLQAAAIPKLFFLPSGSASERAGELFDQSQFDLLLAMARDRFDYVLIDSSPVLAAADSCAIASRMDAVLFVLRARFTALPVARRAIELLQEHHAPLLGTILNRVDQSSEDYPFRHYARYASIPVRSVASLPESAGVAG